MTRLPFAALAPLLLAGAAVGQPKEDRPPPLRYTMRSETGSRSGLDRTSVRRTLEMTADQVRGWVEAADEAAVKEDRSAILFHSGYGETIARNAAGHLEYTIQNERGRRTARNRASVLATLDMTAEQLAAWRADPKGKDEDRRIDPPPRGAAVVTIQTSRSLVSGRVAASLQVAQRLDEPQLRAWAADEKGATEGRSVVFYKAGHLEAIWRGSAGQLLHGVANERGYTVGRDRDAVVGTLKLSDDALDAWIRDEAAAKERRATTRFRSGHLEIVSRGPIEEMPGLPR